MPPERDELTRAFLDGARRATLRRLADWTVGELREHLLADRARATLAALRAGAAARDGGGRREDHARTSTSCSAARKLAVVVPAARRSGCRGASPRASSRTIRATACRRRARATLEGLSLRLRRRRPRRQPGGRPRRGRRAARRRDSRTLRERLGVPTQVCVLAHVTTQMRALERGRAARPAVPVGRGHGGRRTARSASTSRCSTRPTPRSASAAGSHGRQRWYFETGQGSELSSGAHAGRRPGDARGALLRRRAPLPAAAREHGRRLHRARVPLRRARRCCAPGSRTTSWGSCSASRWACDVCYTNHMEADQNDLESLAVLLARRRLQLLHGRCRWATTACSATRRRRSTTRRAARAARPAAGAGVRGLARGARAHAGRPADRRGPATRGRSRVSRSERALRAAPRARTPARLGVGRAGTGRRRPRGSTFRADHAARARRGARRHGATPSWRACARSGSCWSRSAAADRPTYIRRPAARADARRGRARAHPRARPARGATRSWSRTGSRARAAEVAPRALWPALCPRPRALGPLGVPVAVRNGRVAVADVIAGRRARGSSCT